MSCQIDPQDEEDIAAQFLCEDCGEPCDPWTLSDGWGDEKRTCYACAVEAGQEGWRAI